MKKTRLLITGVGAPGIKGTLFCLKKLNAFIIGVDMNENAVGRHFVDLFFPLPAPEHPDYIPRLLTICYEQDVDLIIPQTTREIEVLSALHSEFKVMVSPHEAILQANNKFHLLTLFQELRLPYPHFLLTKSKEELIHAVQELGYPKEYVVIKPPISNGMRGFRILTEDVMTHERFFQEKPSGTEMRLQELLEIFERAPSWPELLVTEYLPGDEYTVDAFIGLKSQVAVARKRNLIRSGISFITTIEAEKEIEEITLNAAHVLKLRYAFGMQFKRDKEGQLKILECNPRIQGTMVASLMSGVNIIEMAVREALGEIVTEIPSKKVGQTFHRFWGGVLAEEGTIHVV